MAMLPSSRYLQIIKTWPSAWPLATTWPPLGTLATIWPPSGTPATTWPLARPLAATWPLAWPLVTTCSSSSSAVCVGHTNSLVGNNRQIWPQLIVATAFVRENTKISLYFHKDCSLFCEEECEQVQQCNGYTGLVGTGLVGLIGLIDSVGLIELIVFDSLICLMGIISCNGLNSFVGCISLGSLIELIKLISLVGLVGLIGLIGHIGLIVHNGLFGFGLVGHTGLVGLFSLNGLGLIGINDHVGFIGLVGLVGLVLGKISLVKLIGHISLVGLVGFSGISGCSLINSFSLIILIDKSATSNHWLISLIGLVGFGFISFGFIESLSASAALLDCCLISLVFSLVSLSAHQAYNGAAAMTATARRTAQGVATMLAIADKIDNYMMILNYLAAGLSIHSLRKINAAITKILWPKQAVASHLELEVATSANKIANALALNYCIISSFHIHSFMREGWLWHVFCLD